MKNKLINIKYFIWDGDAIAASSHFTDDKRINVEFSGKNLVLRDVIDPTKFIKIPRGTNVVFIVNPLTMGYNYFGMTDAQLNNYINTANQGHHIMLN